MIGLKLLRCKLEVTCLQYVEKMITDHAVASNFTNATLTEVSVYGQPEQIAINFSKLLSVLFHRNVKSLTLSKCPTFDFRVNPSLF